MSGTLDPGLPSTSASAREARLKGRLSVALAAVAWSSAGVVQRGLSVDPATQVAGRSAFACLAIFGFVAVAERGHAIDAFRSMPWIGLAFAASTAVSSAAFILALNATTVANVLVLQAISPLLAAILAWAFLGEEVSAGTWLAAVLALLGVVAMVGGPGGGTWTGFALGGVMAASFAIGIVIARARSDVSMAPASCIGQLILVVCLAPMAAPDTIGAHDLLLLGGLGIGQIGLGMFLMTVGAQLIPAAEVGLLSLIEVVLGPIWVWLGRGEAPAPGTLVGGSLVLAAVALLTIWTPRPITRTG